MATVASADRAAKPAAEPPAPHERAECYSTAVPASRFVLETPVHHLIRAIFDDSLRDLDGRRRSVTERELRETLAWIASDATGRGSFSWCCDALGLDPGAVRARIAQGAARPAKSRRRAA